MQLYYHPWLPKTGFTKMGRQVVYQLRPPEGAPFVILTGDYTVPQYALPWGLVVLQIA